MCCFGVSGGFLLTTNKVLFLKFWSPLKGPPLKDLL